VVAAAKATKVLAQASGMQLDPDQTANLRRKLKKLNQEVRQRNHQLLQSIQKHQADLSNFSPEPKKDSNSPYA
jgi:hypothetical protein